MMNNDTFEGTAGCIITGFYDENGNSLKLSEFSHYLEAKCPDCDRILFLTKKKLNRIINCQCGKKIYVEVSEDNL